MDMTPLFRKRTKEERLAYVAGMEQVVQLFRSWIKEDLLDAEEALRRVSGYVLQTGEAIREVIAQEETEEYSQEEKWDQEQEERSYE